MTVLILTFDLGGQSHMKCSPVHDVTYAAAIVKVATSLGSRSHKMQPSTLYRI